MSRAASARPDLLLVGAGIIGGAVALRLIQSGRRFAWIAPFATTAGTATHAAGAMLGALGEVSGEPPTANDEWEIALRVSAADRYPAWLDEIAEDASALPALRMGTFVVAGTRRESDGLALDAMESAATRFGKPCERVAPADVPGLSPAPGFEPERVLSLPEEGFIDAPALCAGLVRAADRSGQATLIDDSVKRLTMRHDRIHGAETERHGLIEAPEVVVCCGAHTTWLFETLGTVATSVPTLLPSKGASLLLERSHVRLRAHEYVLRTPNREFACGVHVVPRSDTTVYVGATNRVSRYAGITGELTASDVLYLLDGVTKEFSTELEHWNVASSSFGDRPLSVDGLPIAGRTEVAGLSVGTGTYRNGVLLAPVIAEAVVNEIDSGRPDPENRLSPTHPGRMAGTGRASEVLASGLRDLAQLLGDAGASWWRAQQPEILSALAALAGTDEQAQTLRLGVAALLERYPRAEMVPEALVELLQELRED